MKFTIGGDMECDLEALIDTRLLVQANSGAGKSWCIRRILEQTHGQVQHLIIDPEGEFASLRERYDYVLAARQGGDTAADPRSAKLLAERLLELGVSAVLDIYELKAHERVRFVRLFIETLVDAPKKLWHPALVVVDEAHVYCPQKGDAESAGAIIDLATRGRKRGFCAVLATQRLSKLHKDAAAECNNKLIGRSSLDVDKKRAGEELGFSGREEEAQLRMLDPGEFFAFGPALARVVTRVTVGPVITTHPKAGARLVAVPPPPTERIQQLLPKLEDLPAEAEERQQTLDSLKRDLTQARRELTLAKREQAPPDEAVIERRVAAAIKRPEGRVLVLEELLGSSVDLLSSVGEAFAELQEAIMEMESPAEALKELRRLIDEQVSDAVEREKEKRRRLERALSQVSRSMELASRRLRAAVNGARPAPAPVAMPAERPHVPGRIPEVKSTTTEGLDGLKKGAVNILRELASRHPLALSKAQVGTLTGFTPSGGTFTTYISELRRRGFIEIFGKEVRVTDAGLDAAGEVPAAPATHDEVMELWRRNLKAGCYRMLEEVAAAGPGGITRDDLAVATDFTASGGTFTTYLSTLRRNGLVDDQGGQLLAMEMLYP